MGKIEDLQKVKKLLDEGLITQKEFENLKLGIIGKSDSNNNIDGVKEKYKTDNKECPNCKSIVLIKSITCSYCNYNFILKRNPDSNKIQTNISSIKDNEKQCPNCMSIIDKDVYKCPYCNYDYKPDEILEKKEHYQLNQDDESSNKKSFIIFGIMILFIAGIWFFNKNKLNEEPINAMSIDTTATVIDTISNAIPVDTSSVLVEVNENIQSVEGYSFEDYKTQKSEKSEKALINYSSNPTAKEFKTLITDGYKSGEINFASYYILVTIGMTGTYGMFGVLVDTRDGKVYSLPNFDVSPGVYCEDASNEFESNYNGDTLIYYSDSTLLVARGLSNNSSTYEFYSFDEEKKEFVKIDVLETPLSKPCAEY